MFVVKTRVIRVLYDYYILHEFLPTGTAKRLYRKVKRIWFLRGIFFSLIAYRIRNDKVYSLGNVILLNCQHSFCVNTRILTFKGLN